MMGSERGTASPREQTYCGGKGDAVLRRAGSLTHIFGLWRPASDQVESTTNAPPAPRFQTDSQSELHFLVVVCVSVCVYLLFIFLLYLLYLPPSSTPSLALVHPCSAHYHHLFREETALLWSSGTSLLSPPSAQVLEVDHLSSGEARNGPNPLDKQQHSTPSADQRRVRAVMPVRYSSSLSGGFSPQMLDLDSSINYVCICDDGGCAHEMAASALQARKSKNGSECAGEQPLEGEEAEEGQSSAKEAALREAAAKRKKKSSLCSPPPLLNSSQLGVTTSCLYSGSKFGGYQTSKGNSYQVEVVFQVRAYCLFTYNTI